MIEYGTENNYIYMLYRMKRGLRGEEGLFDDLLKRINREIGGIYKKG